MSSFNGRTKEYSSISIDRFDGENLKSLVYLLSHIHKDHTVGLFTEDFVYQLQSRNEIKLYCSAVTKDLILLDRFMIDVARRWPPIVNRIVALDVEVSHILPECGEHDNKVEGKITLTLLPAKHCPGSVMFLIEGSAGTVLYTGDYRLRKSELERMDSLKCGNSVKDFKSLYIDTTFCSPEAMYIPPREDSVATAIQVIDDWIMRSRHHVIFLQHAAALGYEQLYREVSNHFNMKVHVNYNKFTEYRRIGDIHTFTTPESTTTQIHACIAYYGSGRRAHKLPCAHTMPNANELQVRTIKLSTMAFVQHVGTEKCMEKISENYIRICYSFHPSLCEIRDTILYLKPGRAFPNVVSSENKHEIQERLHHFVTLARQVKPASVTDKHRLLGKLKVRKKRKLSSQPEDHEFDFMSSPPNTARQADNVKNDRLCDKVKYPHLFGDQSSEDDSEIDDVCPQKPVSCKTDG